MFVYIFVVEIEIQRFEFVGTFWENKWIVLNGDICFAWTLFRIVSRLNNAFCHQKPFELIIPTVESLLFTSIYLEYPKRAAGLIYIKVSIKSKLMG